MWRIFFPSLFALNVFLNVQLEASCDVLPTYFQYSPENLRSLKEIPSTLTIDEQDLEKWDRIIQRLNEESPLGSNLYRLRAYLYAAQRDVSYLSYDICGSFCGSLDPISYEVVKLFFSQVPAPAEIDDEYSKKIAQIVMSKVLERYKREKENLKETPLTRGDPKLRDFARPYSGLEIASWKPWILKDPTQFKPALPKKVEEGYWKEQAKTVEGVLKEVTPEQKEQVLFWSGLSGPGSGSWLKIANDYMDEHKTDFDQRIYIRSVMAEAGVDADIAIYSSKYTYVIPRPWMVNPGIKPLIDKPHHPSYPSGHSVVAAMYAVLLTHFFPENETQWYRLARDAALSRLWGGIHFPIDTWEGRKLGLKIGNELILHLRKQCF